MMDSSVPKVDDGPLGVSFKPTKTKSDCIKLEANEIDRIIMEATVNEGKPLKVYKILANP